MQCCIRIPTHTFCVDSSLEEYARNIGPSHINIHLKVNILKGTFLKVWRSGKKKEGKRQEEMDLILSETRMPKVVMKGHGTLWYSLFSWTRDQATQLSMKSIMYISRWIKPNWRVIGRTHYLPFVIKVSCCCNKRLGLSVMSCTNRLEFLYIIGRQNTQSYNAHLSQQQAKLTLRLIINQMHQFQGTTSLDLANQ